VGFDGSRDYDEIEGIREAREECGDGREIELEQGNHVEHVSIIHKCPRSFTPVTLERWLVISQFGECAEVIDVITFLSPSEFIHPGIVLNFAVV
jgi:hypothetical protein